MIPTFAFHLYNLPTVCRGNAPTFTKAVEMIATAHGATPNQTMTVFDTDTRVFWVWLLDGAPGGHAEPVAEISIKPICV